MERLNPARWAPALGLLVVAGGMWGCGGQARVSTTVGPGHAQLESVSVHSGCPIRDALAKASPDPATASVLVPPHPTGALICRYWGSDEQGQRPAGLAGAISLSSVDSLGRLVARLDALQAYPSHPSPSCPEFGGRSEVIFFHYRGAADDPVRIVRQGCIPVSNGRLVRYGLTLPEGRHWPDEGLI